MSVSTSSIFTAFQSAVKNQSTGILKIQSGKTIRQVIFSKGIFLDVGTNSKEELPGTFLFQQKLLSNEQYQAYLQKCAEPKINQWTLANADIKLAPPAISAQRKAFAKKIIQDIQSKPVDTIQFQDIATIPSETPLLTTLEFFLALTSKLSIQNIQESKNEIKDTTSRISIVRDPAPVEVNDDQSSLFTVLKHSATLDDTFDSSFLEKDKIYQWVYAFELAGLIRIESPVESAKRKFFGSFTDVQKSNLDYLKKEVQRTSTVNFYELLGIHTDADAQDIEQGFGTTIEKYSNETFKNLFFAGEENLAALLSAKVEHAYSILTNPEKKFEYDTFLKTGSDHKFLDQSQTIFEEKLLQEYNELIKARRFEDALKFLGEKITANPQMIKLFAKLVELVRGLKMTGDEALNQKIFGWFKLGITKNPQDFQLFVLLGEWCLNLGQKNNALKAFQKAIQIRAGSGKVREYILKIEPIAGRQTIVQAIYQNLPSLNHFEMFGLDATASEFDIRNAYRETSKHLHPDRFFSSDNQALKDMAKGVFKEIVASYMVLKDATKRKEYVSNLFSSQTKKEEKQKTTVPKSIQAKKYYDQALIFIKNKNLASAKLNIQLALSHEPENYLLQKMLREIKDKSGNA